MANQLPAPGWGHRGEGELPGCTHSGLPLGARAALFPPRAPLGRQETLPRAEPRGHGRGRTDTPPRRMVQAGTVPSPSRRRAGEIALPPARPVSRPGRGGATERWPHVASSARSAPAAWSGWRWGVSGAGGPGRVGGCPGLPLCAAPPRAPLTRPLPCPPGRAAAVPVPPGFLPEPLRPRDALRPRGAAGPLQGAVADPSAG